MGLLSSVAPAASRSRSALCALLGRQPRLVQEVRRGHGGEHARDHARDVRISRVPGQQPRCDPLPHAVRADDELADRPAHALAPGLLRDLRGARLTAVAGEGTAQEAGHAVLGDDAAELVGRGRQQREVAKADPLARASPGPVLLEDEGRGSPVEHEREQRVAAERDIAPGRVPALGWLWIWHQGPSTRMAKMTTPQPTVRSATRPEWSDSPSVRQSWRYAHEVTETWLGATTGSRRETPAA